MDLTIPVNCINICLFYDYDRVRFYMLIQYLIVIDIVLGEKKKLEKECADDKK